MINDCLTNDCSRMTTRLYSSGKMEQMLLADTWIKDFSTILNDLLFIFYVGTSDKLS